MKTTTSHDNPLDPSVVLGVAAHADDLDFSSAGTLASFADKGAKVYYLILTDGSKGSADTDTDNASLSTIRQQEQREAARRLGATDVFFLDYEDGQLQVTPALKRDIVRVIRRVRPDVVLAFDPTMVYVADEGFINHTDHRACGQATIDAVFPLARDHLSFPELYTDEGLQPHKVATLLLTNLEKANFIVDISDYLPHKLEAIKAHVSQVPDVGAVMTRFAERAAETGKPYGFGHAEQFIRIDIPA